MDSRAGFVQEVCASVAGGLRSRRAEIEESVFAYVRDTVPDQIGDEDVEYVVGLRAAVAAAVDYGLTGIEHGEESSGPIPSATIVQARRAAGGGVGLDTVLLRYVAGYTLLEDFVMDEAERVCSSDAMTLRHLRRTQAALLGRLTVSIADEYRQEHERIRRSSSQRLAERVQRLLAGELRDIAGLDYDLDLWHLGVVATGKDAEKAIRSVAPELARHLLLVRRSENTVWAWFGDRRRRTLVDAVRTLATKRHIDVVVAIGEPANGVEGFRLTHRQAQAALLVALRRPQWLTRYADMALLAFALRDEPLARSLIDVYLSPLDGAGKRASALRQTLRAYIAAERNASSAAAALGVARQTVENRIRTVEAQLGRLLPTCLAELEVALRLEELL